MVTDRSELTSYQLRQLRARTHATSHVCIVCGHAASDNATPSPRPRVRGQAGGRTLKP